MPASQLFQDFFLLKFAFKKYDFLKKKYDPPPPQITRVAKCLLQTLQMV